MKRHNSDKAYQDFKHYCLYRSLPHRVLIKSDLNSEESYCVSKVTSYREPADLKKVDKPEILGDIMKADWVTEGDNDANGV